jgi:hypothetical protein
LVWGTPYLGLVAGERAPDPLTAFEELSRGSDRFFILDRNPVYLAKPIRMGGMGEAAPTFTVSRAGPAAIQGSIEAFHQRGSGKGLGQEGNCSSLERPGADALIREGRNENERRLATLDAHMR